MQNPKVSVILPTIGRKSVLRAVESISKQTYDVYEILLIAKKSVLTDTLKEKLKLEFSNIKIFESENGKASENRNLGLENATGNFIAFLDDDDYWLENKIKNQIDFMFEENVQICISAVEYEGEKVGFAKRPCLKKNEDVLKASYNFWWPFTKRPFIGFPTVLFNFELAKDIRFDENLNEREDLWFLHDLQNKGLKIAQLKQVTTVISKSRPFSKRFFNEVQELDFFMRLENLETNLGMKFLINTSIRNAIATGHVIGALKLLYKSYRTNPRWL